MDLGSLPLFYFLSVVAATGTGRGRDGSALINLEQLCTNIEEFIEEYYNRQRPHSALG
jgi:hypothetical protein